MYRPFISCDDPKGVVECGTIRKHRTNSQKIKDKTRSRRQAESMETSFASKPDKEEKVSKGSTEGSFDHSSSLQLMEVSRGAQKLNNMIDSWSKGLRYEGRSEDIARDLLKGALDLQESLVVLRKVQEASQNMVISKRKQNEKSERGRIDAKMVDRSHFSNQFSEQIYPMGFQRPWPSADGSSSSCREELKKVIKESLIRQNLFPSTSTEALDSASEFHSTSSSQSSLVHNDRFSDSSFSPVIARKEKGPSLVARLMGLEEVPSRDFSSVVQKQLESEKILNQKRPTFEIDLPKIRKNSSLTEKDYPERHKTLREILETTHFNGLVKSSSARESSHGQVHHFSGMRHKKFDDLPPIVLIKPRCSPYKEFARVHEPVPQEGFSIRKVKAKPVPSKTFKQSEGSIAKVGKAMEEHVSKRVTKEEKTEPPRAVVELDVKEIKPIENEKAPRGKIKLVRDISKKSQESEIVVDKKDKVKITSKKPLEKEIPKPKVVTKSQDQGEIISKKLRKSQSVSRIEKNEIPSKKSTASNTISKTKNQKTNNSKELIKNQMKKQKPVVEPEAAKPADKQLEQGEEEKSIDVSRKDDCTDIRIINTIADDLAIDDKVDASTNKIIEDCNQNQSSSSNDVMILNSQHEEEAHDHDSSNVGEADCKNDKEVAELKDLLLTSQSFICHAEELLNLDVDCPKIPPKNGTNGIANVRLYLDCANELTERKSLQGSQLVHPLLITCLGNSRLHISLGKLVDEIHVAIGNLRSYSDNSGKKVPSDTIYAMMDRDIKCSGMMNGIWNCGWRHGFSADEAEQVVSEVESLVLSGLIEEVIVNL